MGVSASAVAGESSGGGGGVTAATVVDSGLEAAALTAETGERQKRTRVKAIMEVGWFCRFDEKKGISLKFQEVVEVSGGLHFFFF